MQLLAALWQEFSDSFTIQIRECTYSGLLDPFLQLLVGNLWAVGRVGLEAALALCLQIRSFASEPTAPLLAVHGLKLGGVVGLLDFIRQVNNRDRDRDADWDAQLGGVE